VKWHEAANMFDIAPSSCWRVNTSFVGSRAQGGEEEAQLVQDEANDGRDCEGSF
jgi:hypothetical protein